LATPRKQQALAGVAGAAALLAIVFIFSSKKDPDALPHLNWFYDLGSGKVFVSSSDQNPPIDAPSGPGKGVRAHHFTCTACEDRNARFIGYYEMYTEEGLARFKAGNAAAQDQILLSADAKEWIRRDSEAGAQLQSGVAGRCAANERILRCSPRSLSDL
jgi:hypothetical protein